MTTVIYLFLGLATIGAMCWVLMQLTARQRRLNAELTRLERLSAEVSMNAEAILDRVDERMDRLTQMVDQVEGRVAQAAVAMPQTEPVVAPHPAVEPVMPEPSKPVAAEVQPAPPEPKKRGRPRKNPPPEAPAQHAAVAHKPDVPPPASMPRYQEVRSAVWSHSDKGLTATEIAQQVGIPRGEVLLLLNLRSQKVTA